VRRGLFKNQEEVFITKRHFLHKLEEEKMEGKRLRFVQDIHMLSHQMTLWKKEREEFFDKDFPLKFAYVIESRCEEIRTKIKSLKKKIESVEAQIENHWKICVNEKILDNFIQEFKRNWYICEGCLSEFTLDSVKPLNPNMKFKLLKLVGLSCPHYQFSGRPACSWIGDKQASKVECSGPYFFELCGSFP
jgi:hypothetical protein